MQFCNWFAAPLNPIPTVENVITVTDKACEKENSLMQNVSGENEFYLHENNT